MSNDVRHLQISNGKLFSIVVANCGFLISKSKGPSINSNNLTSVI